jgi:hypothetical protein
MHTVQLLLVEAPSHQEAIQKIDNLLNSENPSWSDWSEIGGRWTGLFGEDEPTNAINYANDPEAFMKWVDKFLEYRKEHMREALTSFEAGGKNLSDLIDEYDPKSKDFELGMKGYYIRKLGGLVADYWGSDSSLWDTEAGTAGIGYLMERIDTNPRHQFAVIVDFHF